MKKLSIILFFLLSLQQTNAQLLNIKIDSSIVSAGIAPHEPSIVINPKNVNEMVAGANNDRVYYSVDGGFNWNNNSLVCSFGAAADPCIVIDTNENYYYFHLPTSNSLDRIVCQKSIDGGQSWSNGTFTQPVINFTEDKEYSCCDLSKNSPFVNSIYTTWSRFSNLGNSVVNFSKSTDGAQTWSTPQIISTNNANWRLGAVPVAGPNGEVYVIWSEDKNIKFNKSLDGGSTWLNTEVSIDTLIPSGLNTYIPSQQSTRIFPGLACDYGNSMNSGNIYMCFSDQRNGSNNTDVFISRSTNGGTTWSSTRINTSDITQTHQFMPAITVDPVTGFVYVVYYDNHNYLGDTTDVYLGWSIDGGVSFSNRKISEKKFYGYMEGHYISISAYNNVVRPIWSRWDYFNGFKRSVWTAIINYSMLSVSEQEENAKQLDLVIHPNPFASTTQSSFYVTKSGAVSIEVYDMFGVQVAKIFDKYCKPGWQQVQFDPESLHLSSNVYYFVLKSEYGTLTKRGVFVRR